MAWLAAAKFLAKNKSVQEAIEKYGVKAVTKAKELLAKKPKKPRKPRSFYDKQADDFNRKLDVKIKKEMRERKEKERIKEIKRKKSEAKRKELVDTYGVPIGAAGGMSAFVIAAQALGEQKREKEKRKKEDKRIEKVRQGQRSTIDRAMKEREEWDKLPPEKRRQRIEEQKKVKPNKYFMAKMKTGGLVKKSIDGIARKGKTKGKHR